MTALELMSNDDFTVFVVDPAPAIRDALTLALGHRGYCLRQFPSRADFLAARAPDWRGCVVAGVDQPAGSGLDFLCDRGDSPLPVILTGADLGAATVRRAFLDGAIDVLPWPVDLDELLAAIARALKRSRELCLAESAGAGREAIPDVLTRREIEVAGLVRLGFDNHSIADRLGISHRTVEVHKSRLMRKLGVRSLAGLIALVMPIESQAKSRKSREKIGRE
jgi:FixJ family two-component response regulator